MQLHTPRLSLQTYTTAICESILVADYSLITDLGLTPGLGWPDADVLDTLPRIIANLAKVPAANGFQSWMVIKRDTQEIIGDIGFKGFQAATQSADLGYGIIASERGNGYATEAALALIAWAFAQPGLHTITANCTCDNNKSAQLLKKLNFKHLKTQQNFSYWALAKPLALP